MTIPRDAVLWGFRFFLRREPDTEEAIVAHMKLKSIDQLAETLLKSPEFAIGKPFGPLLTVNMSPAPQRHAGGSVPKRILLLGNCQVQGLARLFQAMGGDVLVTAIELSSATVEQMASGALDLARLDAENDFVFVHPHTEALALMEQKCPPLRARLKLIPPVNFSAFQPDIVYIRDAAGTPIRGALGEYQSSLAFYGWKNGLDPEQTMQLFRRDVYRHLGFFDYETTARQFLRDLGAMTGIDVDAMVDGWTARGCWMYSINHPRLFVLADVARAVLTGAGIVPVPAAHEYVADDLMAGPVWPLYPELGERWGLAGSYLFKKSEGECERSMPVQMLSLAQFVQASFELFSRYPKEELVCERLDSPAYRSLGRFLSGPSPQPASAVETVAAPLAAAPAQATNPYRHLPDHQFWRRGVERVAMNAVDPVVRPGFPLAPQDRIATAGSCFAQHISRTLQRHGFNYYVSEQHDGTGNPDDARERNFGVFSARFGNIYTARQLVQLFDRAYGSFQPADDCWTRADGRLVDPFRPEIEPRGFASEHELHASRALHFQAVRTLFESLDVLVFTLGLTEAWRNRHDGAVFPLAPGVAGGMLDPSQHEFVNFAVADVVADLDGFVERLQRVNPRARMILTVSPVPLIATYVPRHVIVSTAYSKAVLRAAAEEVCERHALCTYFPSYEVITGSFNRGAYFDSDLRSVKPEGVDHVMRLFTSHYFGLRQQPDESRLALMQEHERVSKVVCDEEAIVREPALPASGSLRAIAGRLKGIAGLRR